MSLEWLIAPCSISAFRAEHWSRATLRVARNDPGYYDPAFSASELEQTLYTASRVDKAVEELSENEVTRPTRGHSGAVAVLKSGKSLRIAGIQRFSLKLAQLSRDLEQLLSSHVNINMYLSPPSGKKALSRHFDTHDVFVMQLHGRKAWKLFGPPMPAPLETLPLVQRESHRDMKNLRLRTTAVIKNEMASELVDEFILEPGDFLYLPRGFWHEAETEPGNVSCHLTVGMSPTTYADLLSLVIAQVALKEPRLRQQLPFGFATHTDATEEVVNTVSEILRELPGQANARTALSDFSDIFHRDHKSPLENRLLNPILPAELEGISATSWVHVRKGLIFGVDESTSPPRLVFGQKKFAIDPMFVDACRYMGLQLSFTAAMLPGHLSDEQKTVLVKQLISEELLLPSAPEEATLEDRVGSQAGWVPYEVRLKADRVRWIRLDKAGLREPFFLQTVKRLNAEAGLRVRGTPLGALSNMKEDLLPSGFIFHISRCGSTLLSNALRCSPGSTVVSEPATISTLLAAPARLSEQGERSRLLQGLLRAYGQKRDPEDRSLVFKFTSWNLLYIAELRRLWPTVPCVIVVRDPLEVAVSCMASPPGWMKTNDGRMADHLSSMLELGGSFIESPEARCAQVLGGFLRLARQQADGLCRIVDYADVNAQTVEQVAKFFHMPLSLQTEGAKLADILATYSKDPIAKKAFSEDSHSKRALATDLLRKEVEQWAAPFYTQALMSVDADGTPLVTTT